jgi:hypothetical protein
MWGAAGEVRALRSLVKRVAASELEIAAAEADETAAHWTAMVRSTVITKTSLDAVICDFMYGSC